MFARGTVEVLYHLPPEAAPGGEDPFLEEDLVDLPSLGLHSSQAGGDTKQVFPTALWELCMWHYSLTLVSCTDTHALQAGGRDVWA